MPFEYSIHFSCLLAKMEQNILVLATLQQAFSPAWHLRTQLRTTRVKVIQQTVSIELN